MSVDSYTNPATFNGAFFSPALDRCFGFFGMKKCEHFVESKPLQGIFVLVNPVCDKVSFLAHSCLGSRAHQSAKQRVTFDDISCE